MWQTVRIITNEILGVKGLVVSRNRKWYCRERKKVLETFYVKRNFVMNINSLTPMSDREKKFSLQYQYNINQISDEDKDKYQFRDN